MILVENVKKTFKLSKNNVNLIVLFMQKSLLSVILIENIIFKYSIKIIHVKLDIGHGGASEFT